MVKLMMKKLKEIIEEINDMRKERRRGIKLFMQGYIIDIKPVKMMI